MAAKKRKKRRPQGTPSNLRHIPKKPTSDQLLHADYAITAKPLDNPYPKHLPTQVSDTLADLYDKAQHQPKEAIPDLERLVATYPQVPVFSNYLSIAYVQVEDIEEAEACILAAYRRHPTYLFAKVNYANLCRQKGEITKIPEIFDEKLDLKLLYPRRKRFHVSEFPGFSGVMCRYYHATVLRVLAEECKALSLLGAGDSRLRRISRDYSGKPILIEALARYVALTVFSIDEAN